MSPTSRAAALLALIALLAFVVPPALAALAALALAAAAVVDALAVRTAPRLERAVPELLSRGVAAPMTCELLDAAGGRWKLRQPASGDLRVEPPEGDGPRLESVVVARRRGRHVLPPVAARGEGPLGLGRWHHRIGEAIELAVYPDLPAATRIATSVRRGRFGEPGQRGRGVLGLGTDFESVRDYQPDDDIRQVNWRATARLGRPMSNQYRVEQDRELLCLVDLGRLMAAPIGERTRLDLALDALAAVALTADELTDRCGLVAFDAAIRRRLAPARAGGAKVVRATYDLEPAEGDADYELAFRTVGGSKRALVLVFSDLLEEAAARPLVEAVPVLARHHEVVVASVTDPEVHGLPGRVPDGPLDVYAQAVALDVLEERRAAARRLRGAGAHVVEAAPEALGAACVRAYLSAKARARL